MDSLENDKALPSDLVPLSQAEGRQESEEPSHSTARCQVCHSPRLIELTEYGALPRITSDCRPFRAGGRLAVCGECDAVQKYPDSQWLQDIGEIYAAYAAYYQADGDEQVILDSRTGQVRRRSDVIVERLLASYPLPKEGRALDIGCGSGVTLRALSNVLPGWHLYGQDLDKRNEQRLQAVSGFSGLFDCPPDAIEGQYDLITLIHSLEHFPSPGTLLKQLRDKLSPNGILLVQVCNSARNPYDLLIADHLMHFSADTLRLLASNCGYAVRAVETEWVGKELTMMAGRAGNFAAQSVARYQSNENAKARVQAQLTWLESMAVDARTKSDAKQEFGIFGSSICATWLAGALGDRVDFFVDEDPSRQQKEFRGKPVLAPQQVPKDSQVYMALVPDIAARVSERLQTLPLQLLQPPPF